VINLGSNKEIKRETKEVTNYKKVACLVLFVIFLYEYFSIVLFTLGRRAGSVYIMNWIVPARNSYWQSTRNNLCIYHEDMREKIEKPQ
jgi:hypothetical protein